MAQTEKIYYDLQRDVAYRADGSPVANDNVPELRYRSKKTIAIQLLNAFTTALDDEFTGFDGVAVAASVAVDNDAFHYDDGAVALAITGGVEISTIKVSGLSLVPRAIGRLRLTNSTGDTEIFYYNNWTVASGVYTFRLSDSDFVTEAQTPTNSYALADVCRIVQPPIVKDAAVDVTDKATGLFTALLDCENIVFQELIHGTTEIPSCRLELTVTSAGDDLLVKQIPVRCLYKLDDDGDVAPAPSGDYYTKTETDALLRAGLSVEFSVDGLSDWHETQAGADRYFRYAYPDGEWSPAIGLIEPFETEFEYSADGLTDWHSDPVEGDRYLRISTDGGSTWGDALLTGALTKDDLEFDNSDLSAGLLTISGTVQVGEILDASGVLKLAPITYSGGNTVIDLTAYGTISGTWKVRYANGGAAPLDALENPMTAAGDIIIGGTAGAATRLAKGTDGQVLTLVSGAPAWAAGGGGSGDVIAPASNTDGYIPQWDGADSKTLKDGINPATLATQLTGNTTVNLTSGMTAAEIQALIDAQPKNLGGYTLTFQFGDGTYSTSMTAALTFARFYNGKLSILGNTADGNYNPGTTDPSVILNFSGGTSSGIYVTGCYCDTITVQALGAIVADASISAFNIELCSGWVYAYRLRASGTAKTAENNGIRFARCPTAYAQNCWFSNLQNGLYTIHAFAFSRDNQSYGTGPTYGLHAVFGATLSKYGATQPTGTTSNELAETGAVIR